MEERIIDSEFSDGARLDENVSTNYGVSRTPVREALQRLVESGSPSISQDAEPSCEP